ncbi:MAG TPA: DUF86 domain-containing protein [Bacillota bacterium]|nr:DUF86 domain-containing protein [Bacillota bacterium]
MLNNQLIIDRLLLIDGYLAELQKLATINREIFLADKKNGAAAESFLRRALETIFDIGRHILARSGNVDLASEYKAIARGLGDLKIIDMELSTKLVQMAGYRNRLVHLYHIVNDEELYEIISTDLGDIVKFISAMKEYLNGSA